MATLSNRIKAAKILTERRMARRRTEAMDKIIANLTTDELLEICPPCEIWDSLAEDELQAIAAGGDPPARMTRSMFPAWFFERARAILTDREFAALSARWR